MRYLWGAVACCWYWTEVDTSWLYSLAIDSCPFLLLVVQACCVGGWRESTVGANAAQGYCLPAAASLHVVCMLTCCCCSLLMFLSQAASAAPRDPLPQQQQQQAQEQQQGALLQEGVPPATTGAAATAAAPAAAARGITTSAAASLESSCCCCRCCNSQRESCCWHLGVHPAAKQIADAQDRCRQHTHSCVQWRA